MSDHVTEVVTSLQKTVEEFKHIYSESELQKKTKGYVESYVTEKMGKVNSDIDKHESDLEFAKKEAKEAKSAVEKLEMLIKSGAFSATKDQVDEKDLVLKSSMEDYIKKGNHGLKVDQIELLAEHTKSMQAFTSYDGGYTVRPQFDNRIIEKIRETSPIRPYADVMTIMSDRIEQPYELDDFASGWVGELGVRDETDTGTLGMVTIEAHEQYAMPSVTQKLLDDSAINIEEYLSRKIASKFERTENLAFVKGSGIKEPRGFLTYDSGTGFNQIEQVNSGLDADITVQGIYDFLVKFKPYYLQGAVWMMPRSVVRLFRGKVDGVGRPLWVPAFAGTPTTIMEHPIVYAEDVPGPAAGSLSIAFGNFREGYRIVDRMGVRIRRDDLTTKGKVKFYTTKRCGGGVINFDAIKILKLSA